MFKKVYKLLILFSSFLPIYVSVTVLRAFLKLGHMPAYGVDPDPIALGICFDQNISFFLIFSVLFYFLLLTITIFVLLVYDASAKNRLRTELCIALLIVISVIGFKLILPETFYWFWD